MLPELSSTTITPVSRSIILCKKLEIPLMVTTVVDTGTTLSSGT